MVLAYSYRLVGGCCSGCSVFLQAVLVVCASGAIEEVWAIGAWLVKTVGVNHLSPTDGASRHILDVPFRPG